jgi:hypothetical protein
VEKSEPSLLVGSKNDAAALENTLEVPQKVKHKPGADGSCL